MKPNFALALTTEGAELLHRVEGGWAPVGAVAFDRPDMDAALADLLAEGQRLAPKGLTTKLIVPDSEIRYATVLAPGPTDEARRYQIEGEIEGLTPYAIDELAYDWAIEGDHAQVAIVARETLIEIEGFAVERGFNPVSFVAIPPGGQFLGEPFFGQTGHAGDLLKPGKMVQPDGEPVRRVAPPRARAAEPPPPVTAPPTPAAPPTPQAPPQSEPAPPAAQTATPAATTTPDAEGEGASRVGDLVRRMGTRLRREASEVEAAPQPDTPPPLAAPLPPRRAGVAPPVSGKTPAAAALAALVPSLRNRGRDDGRATATASAALASAEPETALPEIAPAPQDLDPASLPETETGADASVIAFASRRKSAAAPVVPDPEPAPPGAQPKASAPGGRLAITRRDGAEGVGLGNRARGLARGALGRLGLMGRDAPAPARLTPLPEDLPTPMDSEGRPGTATDPESDRKRRKKKKREGLGSGLGSGLPTDAPRRARDSDRKGRRDRDPAAAPAAEGAARPPRDQLSEAEALTLFGRRGMPEPKPLLPVRALLALGAVVLLLAMVAVWAVYLNRDPAAPTDLAAAPPPADSIAAAPPAAAPPGDSIAAPAALPPAEPAEALPPVTPPPPATEPDATAAAPAQTDPDALLDSLVQDALTEPTLSEVLESLATEPEPEGETAEAVATDPAPDTTAAAPTEATAPEPATSTAAAESPADTPADSAEAAPSLPAASGSSDATAAAPAPSPRLGLPTRLELPQADDVPPASLPTPPPLAELLAGQAVAAPEIDAAPAAEAPVAQPAEPEIELTVTAGRPSSVPAPRPASIAPPPEAAPEPEPAAPTPEATTETDTATATDTAEPVLADDTPRADPALAGARPQPRSPRVEALGAALRAAEPEVAPEDEAEQEPAPAERLDQGALSPAVTPLLRPASLTTAVPDAAGAPSEAAPTPGGLDLALLRPQRRPTDLVPDPAAPAAPEAAEPIDDSAEEAVARSLIPSARPRGFAARVEATLEAERRRTAAAAARAPAATPAAAPAPAATAAAAAPNIPSSASVQREATEARAIRLRDVNLLGVFGTPNNRRALVRMPNGRVVRLQVGDNFDGGRVSAISDSELRYVRGGRDQVLRMARRG